MGLPSKPDCRLLGLEILQLRLLEKMALQLIFKDAISIQWFPRRERELQWLSKWFIYFSGFLCGTLLWLTCDMTKKPENSGIEIGMMVDTEAWSDVQSRHGLSTLTAIKSHFDVQHSYIAVYQHLNRLVWCNRKHFVLLWMTALEFDTWTGSEPRRNCNGNC